MRYLVLMLFSMMFATLSVAQNDRDYIRRGNRMMKDTLFAKAQVQYQKAIEQDNTNSQAHYNLGNALVFQDKAEDAMKEYEQAVKMETNKMRRSQVYHNMGVLLQSAKQYDKALACYRNSLRNDPSNDETRYNYALCLYQMKKQQGQQDNQDQEQDDKGQDEKNQKDEQQQQKQNQQNEQKQEQNEQPDPQKMSKENAEQMLKAAMQDEKETQEKVQQQQQQPQDKHLQKQW